MKNKGYILWFVLIFVIVSLFLPAAGRKGYVPEEPLLTISSSGSGIEGLNELDIGQPGGKLTFGVSNLPETFNQLIAKTSTSRKITSLIMGSGLLDINPTTGRLIPALAKSWRVSEDGLQYTFRLRRGVKFSDGEDLTAEDVLFTYQRLIYDKTVDTSMRSVLRRDGQLPEIEKKGKYRVQFTLKEKYGPFLYEMSTGIYPKHIFIDKKNSKFNDMWSKEFTARHPEKIIGSGPFTVASFKPGKELTLKRNPYYYKIDSSGQQLPYLNRLKFKRIEDRIGKIFNFYANETDVYYFNIRDTAFLHSRKRKENWEIKIRNSSGGAPLNTNFLAFNWNLKKDGLGELFSNRSFRRALSHAIDRKNVVEKVFQGLAFIQDSPISSSSPYYHPEAGEIYPSRYQPQEAKKQLNQLGLTDEDGDRWLEISGKSDFGFTIMVDKRNEKRKEMAGIIKENLREIGIKVDVKVLGFEKMVRKVFSGDFQVVLLNMLLDPLEPSTLNGIYRSKGDHHFWHNVEDGSPGPGEKKIDSLLAKAEKAVPFKDRKSYYDKFQEVVCRSVPLIYTAGEVYMVAYKNNIKNTEKLGTRGSFLENMELIWKTKEEG